MLGWIDIIHKWRIDIRQGRLVQLWPCYRVTLNSLHGVWMEASSWRHCRKTRNIFGHSGLFWRQKIKIMVRRNFFLLQASFARLARKIPCFAFFVLLFLLLIDNNNITTLWSQQNNSLKSTFIKFLSSFTLKAVKAIRGLQQQLVRKKLLQYYFNHSKLLSNKAVLITFVIASINFIFFLFLHSRLSLLSHSFTLVTVM